MVRREEQHWRNTASLFLDTRRSAHFVASSFELAVTAAASIGVHLAGEGFDARLVTDTGEVPAQGTFRDTLLDTLAVIHMSRESGLAAGIDALTMAGGQIVAVLGHVTAEQATQLAAARRGTAQAMALLLVPDDSRPGVPAAAEVLIGAGWRVATVTDGARLAAAWHELHQGNTGVPPSAAMASLAPER
jgi:hypothetical protein